MLSDWGRRQRGVSVSHCSTHRDVSISHEDRIGFWWMQLQKKKKNIKNISCLSHLWDKSESWHHNIKNPRVCLMSHTNKQQKWIRRLCYICLRSLWLLDQASPLYICSALLKKEDVWKCLKSPKMSTCVTTGSGLYLFACVGTSIFMLLHLPGFLFVKFQGLHDSFSLQRNHMNINKDL